MIQCNECGQWFKSLIGHISKRHNLTADEYRNKYPGAETICSELKTFFRDRVSGDLNPGKNHNGKYSPLSKNYIYYTGLTEEEIDTKIADVFKKISTSIQAAPENRSTKLEYYLTKGMSIDEAKSALSTRQKTFSKDLCILRYGEELGNKVWNDRQTAWQHTLNSKSEEEISDINQRKIRNGYQSTSKAEFEIYAALIKDFPELEHQFSIKKDSRCNIIYDFRYKNKIIEYYGDFWHMNPKIYDKQYINPVSKKSLFEKHKEDTNRVQFAELSGYSVLVVWENDYKKNPNEVITKCKKFLTQ